ncbi:MAG: hypothetical protein ACTHKT_03940 [Solirubrobacterales bacterium]
MLAVLAFACFPALAQAESSGAQYESELPNVPHQESSPQHHGNPGGHSGGGENSKAKISETPGGGSGGGGKGGSNGPGGEGNTQQGSPAPEGGGNQKTGGSGPAGNKPHQSSPKLTGASPAAHSSEGSSSPLVPILIAAAVLIAISVGAFYYRQRRQGSGSPISPKAS